MVAENYALAAELRGLSVHALVAGISANARELFARFARNSGQ
jgi:hypothetical protein